MPSLKKRNKQLFLVLIICVGVLALLLGLLYVTNEKHDVVSKEDKKVVVNKDHYGEFVIANKKTELFMKKTKKFKKVGFIAENQKLQLDISKKDYGKYLKIKDSEYYVATKNLKKTDDFVYEENYRRYLPFNENVVTKDKVNLYDNVGNIAYTLEKSIDAPIYVKKNEMNYIVFNHELYGVKAEDTKEVRANANTDQANATRVPVFMYHFFYDEQAGEIAKDNNFTEIHKFREELDYAKQNGYQSVKMKDLDLYLDGAIQLPQKSFVISMDDNAESVKRLAYPALEETQTYATNFVISSWTEDFESIKSNYIELQSHSDAMHQGGCSGMGHGGRLMCIDYQSGVNDLTTSSQKLYGAFVLCYPFGDYNDEAKKILKDAGYTMAFTVEYGYTKPGMDKLQLPRVRMSNSTTVASFAALLEG